MNLSRRALFKSSAAVVLVGSLSRVGLAVDDPLLTYLPTIELLSYMRSKGFRTYIVAGSGQDFVRVYAQMIYGVPPEQVVGTAGGTRYGYNGNGRPPLPSMKKHSRGAGSSSARRMTGSEFSSDEQNPGRSIAGASTIPAAPSSAGLLCYSFQLHIARFYDAFESLYEPNARANY